MPAETMFIRALSWLPAVSSPAASPVTATANAPANRILTGIVRFLLVASFARLAGMRPM
jgi:hypothetical protein